MIRKIIILRSNYEKTFINDQIPPVRYRLLEISD